METPKNFGPNCKLVAISTTITSRKLDEWMNSQICEGNQQNLHIHPGRLTWNLQITNLERKMIFQTFMIMVHVNLPGCNIPPLRFTQPTPLSIFFFADTFPGNRNLWKFQKVTFRRLERRCWSLWLGMWWLSKLVLPPQDEKNLYLCTVDLILCGEGYPLHLFEVPLFGTLPLNWCEMAHVKLCHGFPRRKAQEPCIHISYNSYKWMQNLSVVQWIQKSNPIIW